MCAFVCVNMPMCAHAHIKINTHNCAHRDRKQLQLNWRRAKVFAEYAGAPRKTGTTYVLATWVPPLDPQGRPVPSWLTFQPTALSQFLMSQAPSAQSQLSQQLSQQTIGGLQALETVTPLSKPQALNQLQQPPLCTVQTSCHACASLPDCEWCGGQEICSSECAPLPSVVIYTKPDKCLARSGLAADVDSLQRVNQQSIKNLVALSQMTSGTPLVAAATAQVREDEEPPLLPTLTFHFQIMPGFVTLPFELPSSMILSSRISR